jgi:hypothetical protein
MRGPVYGQTRGDRVDADLGCERNREKEANLAGHAISGLAQVNVNEKEDT